MPPRIREKHLIPIIRLATQPEGENWRAPNPEDASAWAEFLNKLHWVVKDRYIILFNEPNHGTEWGGAVDPVRYGQIAADFAYALKQKSPDFRIMLAGFDLAAPQSPPNYYDAYQYIQEASKSFFTLSLIPAIHLLLGVLYPILSCRFNIASGTIPSIAFRRMNLL